MGHINDTRKQSGTKAVIKHDQALINSKKGTEIKELGNEYRSREVVLKSSESNSRNNRYTCTQKKDGDGKVPVSNPGYDAFVSLETMRRNGQVGGSNISERYELLQPKPLTRASARFIESQIYKTKQSEYTVLDKDGGILPYTAYITDKK